MLEAGSAEDARRDLEVLVEKQLYGTLHAPIYYTIPTTPPIIAIDARSDREFVAPIADDLDDDPGEENLILSHVHPDDMILSDTQFRWLEEQLETSPTPIVACSVPLLQTLIGDRLLTLARWLPSRLPIGVSTQRQVDYEIEHQLRKADADTWFAFPESVAKFLKLISSRQAVIFLAGDVHYSYIYNQAGFDIQYEDDLAYRGTGHKRKHLIKSGVHLLHATSSPIRYPANPVRTDGVKQYGGLYPLEKNEQGQWQDTIQIGNKENSLRDPFGLPVPVFSEDYFERRYTVENVIAIMEVPGRDLSNGSVDWMTENSAGDLVSTLARAYPWKLP